MFAIVSDADFVKILSLGLQFVIVPTFALAWSLSNRMTRVETTIELLMKLEAKREREQ